jgi:hypothetical protein
MILHHLTLIGTLVLVAIVSLWLLSLLKGPVRSVVLWLLHLLFVVAMLLVVYGMRHPNPGLQTGARGCEKLRITRTVSQ